MLFEKCRKSIGLLIDSRWFIAIQFIAAAVCMVFHATVPGLMLFSAEILLLLLFSDDTFAVLCPLIFVAIMVTDQYEHYYGLLKYSWLLILGFGALLFHLIYYRKPFVKGRFIWAYAAVSIVLLTGGIGVISKEEYFTGLSFYYMLGLGLAPFLVYVLLCSRLSVRRNYDFVGRMAEIGYAMAFLAVLLIVQYYVAHFRNWDGPFQPPEIPYRNFCTTVMLFGLPMPCYFVHRTRWHLLSIPLIYIVMLFSASRSALLFGTIELALCLFSVYKTDATRKKYYRRLAVILLVPLTAVVVISTFMLFIGQNGRLGSVGKHFINPQEDRVKFFIQGMRDFAKKPIFGYGLANMKNKDIFLGVEGSICFYHNAVIQVAASLGIIGVIAYAYQFILRVRFFWQIRHTWIVLMAVPFIGVLLISQTNPGIFAPLPTTLMLTMMFAALEFSHNGTAEPDLKTTDESEADDLCQTIAS
ncbi:MAG: O-antigen ligase family protein [Clostridia bacterium]|nr:O-antigen ligase family protein [Clostridia bacterium]